MDGNFNTLSLSDRVAVGLAGGLTLDEQETIFRAMVVNAALIRYEGNQCHAAKALGIHRNTLARIIDDLRDGHLLYASLRRSDYLSEKKDVQSVKPESFGSAQAAV